MDTKILKPADIILTRSNTMFGKSIIFFLRLFQNDRIRYQHTILVKKEETLIEALSKIKETNFNERKNKFKSYIVIRNINLTDEQREKIVKKAEYLIGLEYSYIRLTLQLLDQIFHTNFFTRNFKSTKNQICSTVVSWSYYTTAKIKFNNINWKSCEPDDIDDELLKNPNNWEVIFKK